MIGTFLGARRPYKGRALTIVMLITLFLSLPLLALGVSAQTTSTVIFYGDPKVSDQADVTTYFGVRGGDGFPRTDLKLEDINLTEDGAKVANSTLDADNEPAAIVLVLDVSASTRSREGTQTGPMRFEAEKNAAANFVRATKPSDQIAVATFNQNWTLVQPFTDDQLTVLPKINSIAEPVNRAGTCLYDAIYKAADYAATNSARAKAIVVLTDGIDERYADDTTSNLVPCSSYSVDEVLDRAAAAHSPIYTLGLGRNVDASVLDKLATRSGGQYGFAADASQLDQVFQDVARKLQGRYVLQYRSTNVSGAHQMRLAVAQANADPASSEKTVYIPPVAPTITRMQIDPMLPGNILQGKVKFSPEVDLPRRLGKLTFRVGGPNPVEASVTSPPWEWTWDTTAFLAGQSSLPVTLEVQAYDTAGLSFTPFTTQFVVQLPPTPVPTFTPAPQPTAITIVTPPAEDLVQILGWTVRRNDLVLLGIGAVAIITLLLVIFMFLTRGRIAAVIAHKPSGVTKGEPLAQLVLLEGPGVTKSQEHFLYGDRSVGLGRDEDQAIQLPGERVSREHGEIIYRRNQFLYNETKAANGTTIDGQSVVKGTPVALRDGAEIVFADQTHAIFRMRTVGAVVAAGSKVPDQQPTVAAGAARQQAVPQNELRTTEWVPVASAPPPGAELRNVPDPQAAPTAMPTVMPGVASPERPLHPRMPNENGVSGDR